MERPVVELLIAGACGLVASACGPTDDAGADRCQVALEPQLTRYAQQPMVVDVWVQLSAPAEATLVHDADPGVRVQGLEADEDLGVGFRVRGLAPETKHVLTVRGVDGEPCGDQASVSFETESALDGFIGHWDVNAGPGQGEPEPLLRIFDLSNVPAAGLTRTFAVDPDGTTRFYLGESTTLTGPTAVRAGIKLRADGTLVYLYDDSIVVVDELGELRLRVTASELGVAGLHHDVFELANGNFLTLGYTFRNIDYPVDGIVHVAGDVVLEVSPAGDLVWSWNTFDHLDPLRVRDGFELNVPDPANGEPGKDWTHSNGVIERDGLILLSMRHQDWIVAIDRELGALRWRLGPEGDFALEQGRWFFHQHSPQWQPDGTLLLYDNGVGNPDLEDAQERSRAVAYAIDEDAMTVTQRWEDDEAPFTAPVAGDADALPGGHLLVLDSSIGGLSGFHGRLRELDPKGNPMRLWSLESEDGTFMYRAIASPRLVGEAAG